MGRSRSLLDAFTENGATTLASLESPAECLPQSLESPTEWLPQSLESPTEWLPMVVSLAWVPVLFSHAVTKALKSKCIA